ncbi:MAG TPA: histidine kinase [Aquaticitalea sp.]|nr:histidine kinase [Aquaticitalea sp.]HNU59738.1 histidine kinase [Aquaticitalea sp.]
MIDFIPIFAFQAKDVSTSAERYLLLYTIGVLMVVTTFIILFFIVFQKRKNKILLDKIKQQQAFDAEISRTQTEIQEETLKHLGWELHDNIGQLLAFASMQMGLVLAKTDEGMKKTVQGASEAIKDSLEEVRALSRSLNNEVVTNIGLEKSIANELTRIRKMRIFSTDLEIMGQSRAISNNKSEIVLFRILQEFLSNSIKYSSAKNLKVQMDYRDGLLHIEASDDGLGFDMQTTQKGSGILNMTSRAKLIGANLVLKSKPDEGTQLYLDYPLD